MANEVEVRQNIIKIFQKQPQWTFKKIAKEVGANPKTISRVIKRFKEDLLIDRKKGSGKKKGPHDRKKAKNVVTILKRDPSISGRKLARKADCSESFVRRTKKEAGLKTYKMQKVPDRNAVKNETAKQRAKKLNKDFVKKFQCCIMDDETYVLADFSQLPGQEFYTADSRGNVAEKFKAKKITKFPKKFLVWQAICSCGKKSSSFVTSGTVNSEIYVKECLQKRLLPFLRKHEVSTFFWPDLASCHYSKMALEWFQRNEVVLVPREANPPNCPELRPIERYWALIKREMKSTKKVAKNIEDFKGKWSAAALRLSDTTIKRLMEGVPEKIKIFIKN